MDVITTVFEQSIGYARAQERLIAALAALEPAGNAIRSVLELEAELAPELSAAIGHLLEAADALQRASKVIDARMSDALERAKDAS